MRSFNEFISANKNEPVDEGVIRGGSKLLYVNAIRKLSRKINNESDINNKLNLISEQSEKMAIMTAILNSK